MVPDRAALPATSTLVTPAVPCRPVVPVGPWGPVAPVLPGAPVAPALPWAPSAPVSATPVGQALAAFGPYMLREAVL